jgi:SpoVK/Ycf46/Vps4 family AAA+-type ATPase
MEGFVGADIEAVCRKAGMLAIRDFLASRGAPDQDYSALLISQRHFDQARALVSRQISQTALGEVP